MDVVAFTNFFCGTFICCIAAVQDANVFRRIFVYFFHELRKDAFNCVRDFEKRRLFFEYGIFLSCRSMNVISIRFMGDFFLFINRFKADEIRVVAVGMRCAISANFVLVHSVINMYNGRAFGEAFYDTRESQFVVIIGRVMKASFTNVDSIAAVVVSCVVRWVGFFFFQFADVTTSTGAEDAINIVDRWIIVGDYDLSSPGTSVTIDSFFVGKINGTFTSSTPLRDRVTVVVGDNTFVNAPARKTIIGSGVLIIFSTIRDIISFLFSIGSRT